jgi:hypothetical protein
MFGTVFLVLMHVAIAQDDSFSEPFGDSYAAGIYRLNAPCPYLIVTVQTEIRGQSAKTPVFLLFYGN